MPLFWQVGEGSRLGSLVKHSPKPMLNVGQKPFLTSLIQQLSRQGLEKIIILAGYHGQIIKDSYHNKSFGNCTCKVVIEQKLLGTGGALSQVQFDISEEFFVLNADTFVQCSLGIQQFLHE